jgi:trehalose 2-sulfotransferase
MGHRLPLVYLICTCPRSGSSLLSEGLTSTGYAGRPDEYFDPDWSMIRHWMQQFQICDIDEYVDQLIAQTSSNNGVFGFKLHWSQLKAMKRLMRHSLQAQHSTKLDPSISRLFEQKFNDVKYVWLRRRNKVLQAISYYRAVTTGIWRTNTERQNNSSNHRFHEIAFDFDQIDHYVNLCRTLDLRWGQYFRREQIHPLIVIYEEFVARYEPTINGILNYLGVGVDAPIAAPTLMRQADDASFEWEARYRTLKSTHEEWADVLFAVADHFGLSTGL